MSVKWWAERGGQVVMDCRCLMAHQQLRVADRPPRPPSLRRCGGVTSVRPGWRGVRADRASSSGARQRPGAARSVATAAAQARPAFQSPVATARGQGPHQRKPVHSFELQALPAAMKRPRRWGSQAGRGHQGGGHGLVKGWAAGGKSAGAEAHPQAGSAKPATGGEQGVSGAPCGRRRSRITAARSR